MENHVELFEPFVTVEQAAQALGGIHVKTLQRKARAGEIPAYLFSRRWLFRLSEISHWMLTSPNVVRSSPANPSVAA